MNLRKLSTELSHHDITELEAAKHHAGVLGLPLNTHVAFVPFADDDAATPTPGEIAHRFKRLLKNLTMWVRRNTGRRFTYLRVAHSDEDGSGRNPHLHVLLHLPTDRHRERLQAALSKVYGRSVRGDWVADVKPTFERVQHPSGYLGSTFGYVTRHKSQKAYWKQGGRSWRASTRDKNGRHRGIKTPFVGRRWATSRNINAKACTAYDEAQRYASMKARISAERKRVA